MTDGFLFSDIGMVRQGKMSCKEHWNKTRNCMIHPPPVALIDHVHAEKTLSSQRTVVFWAKENQEICQVQRCRSVVLLIILASEHHSCCFRSDGKDIYSAAFSGSAAAGAASSLDSAGAVAPSPPLGSASDEVQRVCCESVLVIRAASSARLPGYLLGAAL